MTPLTRTACTQKRTHSLGDSPLTANHFAIVIGGDMQLQHQGIAIIANFAHLHSRGIVNQRFRDVLDESTHFSTLLWYYSASVGAAVAVAFFICSKRSITPARLSRLVTESDGCAPFFSQPSAFSSSI